jgi:hypothetical protein
MSVKALPTKRSSRFAGALVMSVLIGFAIARSPKTKPGNYLELPGFILFIVFAWFFVASPKPHLPLLRVDRPDSVYLQLFRT